MRIAAPRSSRLLRAAAKTEKCRHGFLFVLGKRIDPAIDLQEFEHTESIGNGRTVAVGRFGNRRRDWVIDFYLIWLRDLLSDDGRNLLDNGHNLWRFAFADLIPSSRGRGKRGPTMI